MAQKSLDSKEWIRPRKSGAFSCYNTMAMQDIIATLDTIAANKENKPLYILGGYIVGATLVRDDFESLREEHPILDTLSELGAELETIEKDEEALPIFREFQDELHRLKQSLKKS